MSKKDDILEVSTNLFLKQGFTATSLDQIIEVSKTSKGAFFHYFSSKLQLGELVIENYFKKTEVALKKSFNNPKTTANKILDSLENLIDWFFPYNLEGGCLLSNLALEMSDSYPTIQTLLKDKFNDLEEIYFQEIRSIPKFRLQASPQSISRFLVWSIQGLVLYARVQKDRKLLKEETAILKKIVSQMLGITI